MTINAQLNMYKFESTRDYWEKLEKLLGEKYPANEIRYVCRMTPELEAQGYHELFTPSYKFKGCEGSQYRSFLISPFKKIPDVIRTVVNYNSSFSGRIVLDDWLEKNVYSELSRYESSSHMQSVKDLFDKKADLASIDCISWGYIQKEIPECKDLYLIDQSPLIKGHPIIIDDSENDFDLIIPDEIVSNLNLI